jgi:hypothetical protein
LVGRHDATIGPPHADDLSATHDALHLQRDLPQVHLGDDDPLRFFG